MSVFDTKVPAGPDPSKVAIAQGAANISVAIAQSVLGNADEDTPEATVTFSTPTTYSLLDPQYDASGNQTGTTTRAIPRFLRTTAFKAGAQAAFDKSQSAKTKMLTWTEAQADSLLIRNAQPFNLAGLPNRTAAPTAPTLANGPIPNPAIITSLGLGDLAALHTTQRDAIRTRLLSDIVIERNNRINELNRMGLYAGMRAYDRELIVFSRRENDAIAQAELQADQLATNAVQREMIKAQFENDAAMLTLQVATIKIDIANGILVKRFELDMMLVNYADTLREDSLKERVLERTQPMNEVIGMLHGAPIQIPQFRPYQAGQIGYTPLAESIYQFNNINRQNAINKAQQQQSLFAGIIGFGANIVGGGLFG